eukprot:scpid88210/ scgid2240/ 
MFARLYSEKTKDGGRNMSCIRQHLNQISQFLIDDLAHHDFKHAALVMSTLMHDAERLGEIVWKCGAEVLDRRPNTRQDLLPYLKGLFLRLKEHREELFLEIILLMVHDNMLREAYIFCTSNIHQKPFKDNPMLRGYCGMLAYLLWLEDHRAAEDTPADNACSQENFNSSSFPYSGFQSSLGFDLNLTSGMNSLGSSQLTTASPMVRGATGETQTQLRDTAMKHFQSLEDVPGSWDAFVLAYVELIEQAHPDSSEVRHVLEMYKETNPTSANANCFLCSHLIRLYEKRSCSKEEVRHAFLSLIEVCPTSDLLLQFPQFAESPAEATETVMQFLDYPQCAGCACGWQQLEDCLVELRRASAAAGDDENDGSDGGGGGGDGGGGNSGSGDGGAGGGGDGG